MKEFITRQKHVTLKREEGWTFVETLVVIAIIIVLTGTVGFTALGFVDKGKVAAARAQIDTFETLLETYALDCGSLPTQDQGLKVLVEKPVTDPIPSNWAGPYLKKGLPKDPWGNDYVYIVPGPNNLPYGITSLGSDGKPGGTGTAKDINSWEN